MLYYYNYLLLLQFIFFFFNKIRNIFSDTSCICIFFNKNKYIKNSKFHIKSQIYIVNDLKTTTLK